MMTWKIRNLPFDLIIFQMGLFLLVTYLVWFVFQPSMFTHRNAQPTKLQMWTSIFTFVYFAILAVSASKYSSHNNWFSYCVDCLCLKYIFPFQKFWMQWLFLTHVIIINNSNKNNKRYNKNINNNRNNNEKQQ